MRFVVIDFEATCDEPHNPSPQEVIEFPAVLVEPGGPHDGAEFRTFVRPVVHSWLTPFCLDLTGISQDEVDAAPTFPEVLSQFDAWYREFADGALAVTCGDWDLGHGQRVSDWLKSQDFREELRVHEAPDHLAPDAVLDGMALQQGDREPPQPTQVVG